MNTRKREGKCECGGYLANRDGKIICCSCNFACLSKRKSDEELLKKEDDR